MMTPTNLMAGAAFLMFAASAQEAPVPSDPLAEAAERAIPTIESPPPLSELDALSASPDAPFPEFETETVRRPVSATFRALDKITARYSDIVVKIGEKATFASLEILPRHCDKRPPEDFPETTAFVEIFDRNMTEARTTALAIIDPKADGNSSATDEALVAPPQPEASRDLPVETHFTVDKTAPVDPERIFSGWMFASSPALNPLEHPVYDVWVIDCKTVSAAK